MVQNVPRFCVKEEFIEAQGFYTGAISYEYICKEWIFTYSDGEIETVTKRVKKCTSIKQK